MRMNKQASAPRNADEIRHLVSAAREASKDLGQVDYRFVHSACRVRCGFVHGHTAALGSNPAPHN